MIFPLRTTRSIEVKLDSESLWVIGTQRRIFYLFFFSNIGVDTVENHKQVNAFIFFSCVEKLA